MLMRFCVKGGFASMQHAPLQRKQTSNEQVLPSVSLDTLVFLLRLEVGLIGVKAANKF